MGETFGQLVKRLRKQAGLTQAQLAAKSQLSEAMISKYEQGRRVTQFRKGTLEQLAHGLGLSKDSPDRQLLFQVAWEHEQRERAAKSALRFAGLWGPVSNDQEPEISPPAGVLATRPQVLTRMEDIADCAVAMLDKAPELDKAGEGEILVTTLGGSSLFQHLGQEDRWNRAIRLAMSRNWNVVSLYRLTGDLERAFEVIREIRNLSVYPEQYLPRYFRQIGELRPAYALLIVPPIGGLLAFSTHNPSVVDTAFFYPATHPDPSPYIDSLLGHFNLLFAETVQLARTYKPRSPE